MLTKPESSGAGANSILQELRSPESKYDNSVSFSTFKRYQYQPSKGKKYKN